MLSALMDTDTYTDTDSNKSNLQYLSINQVSHLALDLFMLKINHELHHIPGATCMMKGG